MDGLETEGDRYRSVTGGHTSAGCPSSRLSVRRQAYGPNADCLPWVLLEPGDSMPSFSTPDDGTVMHCEAVVGGSGGSEEGKCLDK